MPHPTHFYLPAWLWWAFFVACLIVSTWGVQRRLAERRTERQARQEERAQLEQLYRHGIRHIQELTTSLTIHAGRSSVSIAESDISEPGQLDSEIETAIDQLFHSAAPD